MSDAQREGLIRDILSGGETDSGAPQQVLFEQWREQWDEEIRAFAEPWRDLLEFDVPARVSAMLEPRGMQVQAFEDALGPLNLDFFSVLVTRMPMVEGSRYTPAELFQRMRLSINEFIATAVSEFTPYEGSDDARWRSNTPIGTVFRNQCSRA